MKTLKHPHQRIDFEGYILIWLIWIGVTFDGIARRASNKNPNGRHVDYLMAIIDKMYETELR